MNQFQWAFRTKWMMRGETRAFALVAGVLGASIAAGSGALSGCSSDQSTTTSGAGASSSDAGAGGMTTSGSVGSGGAGGMTGAGGVGGMTGAGGAGGAGMPCNTPIDCGPAFRCHVFECNNGKCTLISIDGGSFELDPSEDPSGDCNKAVCVNGELKYQPDPADVPIDNAPCTKDLCSAPAIIDHSPIPQGTNCQLGPGSTGVCDQAGQCVECLQASPACTSCVQGQCIVGDTCMNGLKDPGETGIDCGGPCFPCSSGKPCVTASDCIDGVCTAGKCALAKCSDGVRNGSESDVDCGGACPFGCNVGKQCLADTDCFGGLCKKGACQFTCGDGVQDGLEEGVDCGGPGCSMFFCP